MSKIPQGEWNAIAARYTKGESITRIAQSYGCTPPAIHYILKRNKLRPAAEPECRVNGKPEAPAPISAAEARPAAGSPVEPRRVPDPEIARASPISREPVRPPVPQPPVPRQQPANSPRPAARGSAFTAGLDSELHGRAEAAIAAFRSSFDAALAEGSPSVHQRLREAASDLMRVAARTTIVLDRLNASTERELQRTSDRRPGYGR